MKQKLSLLLTLLCCLALPSWAQHPGGASATAFSWYRYDSLSALTNGVNVTSWADEGNSNPNLPATPPGTVPTYSTSAVNGHPGVHCPVGSTLTTGEVQSPTGTFFMAQPRTVFAAVRIVTEANNGEVFDDNGTSNQCAIGVTQGVTPHKFYINDNNGTALVSSAVPDTTSTYVCAVFNGASSKLYVGGALVATGSTSAVRSAAHWSIGGNGLLDCYISEVIVFPSVLSGADFTLVDNYMAGRYSPVPPPPPAVITADDAKFIPVGHWAQTGTGSSARLTTICTGSQIKAAFTGQSCTLNFDTALSGTDQYPDILYEIDGGPRNRVTLDSTGDVACAFPTVNTVPFGNFSVHTLTITAEGVWDVGTGSTTNIWGTLTGACRFKGVTLDNAATLLTIPAPTGTMEIHGDSIVDTVRTLEGATFLPTAKAGHIGWPTLAAQYLGLAPVPVGYGGAGLVKHSNGNTTTNASGVPLANANFAYTYSGVAYSPTVKPSVVVIEYGTNDQGQGVGSVAFQTAAATYLTTVRTAYPAALIEWIILPSSNSYTSAITAAVAAASNTKTKYHDYSSGLFVSGDYSDTVHLNVQGNAKLGAKLATDIAADMATLNIRTQPVPAAADVRSGTHYGAGNALTGTLAATGGGGHNTPFHGWGHP